jgi:hypothetical protein
MGRARGWTEYSRRGGRSRSHFVLANNASGSRQGEPATGEAVVPGEAVELPNGQIAVVMPDGTFAPLEELPTGLSTAQLPPDMQSPAFQVNPSAVGAADYVTLPGSAYGASQGSQFDPSLAGVAGFSAGAAPTSASPFNMGAANYAFKTGLQNESYFAPLGTDLDFDQRVNNIDLSPNF